MKSSFINHHRQVFQINYINEKLIVEEMRSYLATRSSKRSEIMKSHENLASFL
ncbi:hypothetical protein HanRHA438_Chr09g0387631 [Helianthus annuus]|nr:hypothetical protein HanRHA438_Chr09g0387631 [Helianthus annuus]